MLLAARASEDHLESTILMVTLDLPDPPDLQDIMVLRALLDRLDYLVFRVFVDHLGSIVPTTLRPCYTIYPLFNCDQFLA